MSKARVVFIVGVVLMIASGANLMAQEAEISLFGVAGTTSQSAVLATFVASIDDGTAAGSSLSVSNLLGAPVGEGFPTGGDESGAITLYLFNSIGTVYMFSTAEHPDVGAGLNPDGTLSPGGTWTVQLSEILTALHPDRVPADRDFAGYAWVIADFDAVGGTYFNSFPLAGASQAFLMEPAGGGLPVSLDGGQ
ncbi:MAG TPA: hypothetical protein VLV83_08795 [Acidobacteriota bacterium]|nr:hypothetical protein [Acidobacteriota bacterium]